MIKWLSKFQYKLVKRIENSVYWTDSMCTSYGVIYCFENGFGWRKLKCKGNLWPANPKETRRYNEIALPWLLGME